MALYSYSKTVPGWRKRFASIISLILIFAGLFLLIMVLYPIVTFELYYAHKYTVLASPIFEDNEKIPHKITEVLDATFADFTRASVWFPKASPIITNREISNDYLLSIPKL